MSYQHLELSELAEHVKLLRIVRGSKANALSPDVLEEIEAVSLELRDDTGTRALVVTGQGKHFSSGRRPERRACGVDS